MINVQAPRIVVPERVAPPIKRIGPRAFLIICTLEGLLIAAVFLVAMYALAPQHVPLVRSSDYATVREAIWARLNGTIDDPLVEITSGVSARESNVRGFALHGETYYYYIEGQRGFDRQLESTRSWHKRVARPCRDRADVVGGASRRPAARRPPRCLYAIVR